MQAAVTLIAWNSRSDTEEKAPAGSLAVGPLLQANEGDWIDWYTSTGGAAYAGRQNLTECDQVMAVLQDFYRLVYLEGLDPYIVHRAFLHIDEYQEFLRDMEAGPAPGELGHDPQLPFGRSDNYALPEVNERRIGRSIHIWPNAGGQ